VVLNTILEMDEVGRAVGAGVSPVLAAAVVVCPTRSCQREETKTHRIQKDFLLAIQLVDSSCTPRCL